MQICGYDFHKIFKYDYYIYNAYYTVYYKSNKYGVKAPMLY